MAKEETLDLTETDTLHMLHSRSRTLGLGQPELAPGILPQQQLRLDLPPATKAAYVVNGQQTLPPDDNYPNIDSYCRVGDGPILLDPLCRLFKRGRRLLAANRTSFAGSRRPTPQGSWKRERDREPLQPASRPPSSHINPSTHLSV